MLFSHLKRSHKSLKFAVAFCCALSLSATAQTRQNRQNTNSSARIGGDGGGGGAFVCNLHDFILQNDIRDSELLDLWEAQNVENDWPDSEKPHTLTIKSTNEISVNKQIEKALNKLRVLDQNLYERVLADLKYVMNPKNIEIVDLKKKFIQPPKDAHDVYGQPNDLHPQEVCPLKGMMYFNNKTKKLQIDPLIYSKLKNNTNIAASMTHEAIYKTFRETSGHTDSILTRKLNGCLYAEEDCLNIKKPGVDLPTDRPVYKCATPSSEFYLYSSNVYSKPGFGKDYKYVMWYAYFLKLGNFQSQFPIVAKNSQLVRNDTDMKRIYAFSSTTPLTELDRLEGFNYPILVNRDLLGIEYEDVSFADFQANNFKLKNVFVHANEFIATGKKTSETNEVATCQLVNVTKP